MAASFSKRGIDLFGHQLCPSVVDEIVSWEAHPELGKLFRKLQSLNDADKFLDHYAEALLARCFVHRGLNIEIEAVTPNGKKADFRFIFDKQLVCVHLKRLRTETKIQEQLRISQRLFSLQKIRRPLAVSVRLFRRVNDLQAQLLYKEATRFVGLAQHGDLKRIVDLDGAELAECEIGPRVEAEHVLLAIHVILPV